MLWGLPRGEHAWIQLPGLCTAGRQRGAQRDERQGPQFQGGEAKAMKRFQARRGNGRFTRNTMENTFGLHCEVCDVCRSLSPWAVGEPKPKRCHNCGALLGVNKSEPERHKP
jgi:hypothetical protein